MNNDIQEAYCSFEVSKLLKEKGFDVPLSTWYDPHGKEGFAGMKGRFNIYCARPIHALAIEWIRVNFGIFIYPQFQTWDDGCFTANWCLKNGELWNFHDLGVKKDMFWKRTKFNSPQEATEAALLHVLKNLI